MIGEVGVVRAPVGTGIPGWVFVHGELWRAVAATAPEDAHDGRERPETLKVGRRVRVVDLEGGTTVVVLPCEPSEDRQR